MSAGKASGVPGGFSVIFDRYVCLASGQNVPSQCQLSRFGYHERYVRTSRYPIGCLVLVVLHALAHRAEAAELTYQAPPGCPDREELSFRIARALGEPLEEAPPMRFDVAVRAVAGGFSATLRVETADHAAGGAPEATSGLKERSLEAQDCSQLVDAVSVAVVLALGRLESAAPEHGANTDDRTAAASPSTKPSAPLNAPSDDNAPVDEIEQFAPSSDSTALRPGVFVWMLGDAGSLPSAGLGAGIGAQLDWSRWRVRAHASVMFEQHVDVEAASALQPGADLGLVVGGVALCRNAAELQPGALTLALCLGGELGRLSGRGTNVVPERSGSALWAAPTLDASARLDLGGGAGLDLMLGGALPLTRNPFIIDDIGSVHRAAPLAARGALALSWSFR
jgi:hypothetical protein